MEPDSDAHCAILKALCSKAREILVEECNVQRVDAPVTAMTSKLRESKLAIQLVHSKRSYVLQVQLYLVMFATADIQDLRGHPWPVL